MLLYLLHQENVVSLGRSINFKVLASVMIIQSVHVGVEVEFDKNSTKSQLFDLDDSVYGT